MTEGSSGREGGRSRRWIWFLLVVVVIGGIGVVGLKVRLVDPPLFKLIRVANAMVENVLELASVVEATEEYQAVKRAGDGDPTRALKRAEELAQEVAGGADRAALGDVAGAAGALASLESRFDRAVIESGAADRVRKRNQEIDTEMAQLGTAQGKQSRGYRVVFDALGALHGIYREFMAVVLDKEQRRGGLLRIRDYASKQQQLFRSYRGLLGATEQHRSAESGERQRQLDDEIRTAKDRLLKVRLTEPRYPGIGKAPPAGGETARELLDLVLP